MSEFDSGDDLFDGVDADQLIQSGSGLSNKRPLSSAGSGINDPAYKKGKLDKLDSVHTTIAHKILRERFGHTQFRHEQEEAVAAVLRGENSLVIFPTGAGKSLCYQVSRHWREIDNALA